MLLQSGIVGIFICGVTANYIFAAGDYAWSERVDHCNKKLTEAQTLVAADWSRDEAKQAVPTLNTALYDTISCIDALERTHGVTRETEKLRASLQESVATYMEEAHRHQTAVTWILDSYSKNLTESLIAQAS